MNKIGQMERWTDRWTGGLMKRQRYVETDRHKDTQGHGDR